MSLCVSVLISFRRAFCASILRAHSVSTVLKKPKKPRRKFGRHFLRPGTNGGVLSLIARMRVLITPVTPWWGGREIFGNNGPCHAGQVAELPHCVYRLTHCAALLHSLPAWLGLASLRTAARWLASRARRAQRHHTCITSGGTSVISVFDEACRWAAGVRYGVTPGGVPERLASRTPPRPNQIFADLIGPMAFILAVRVSRRASDTHMPSGKMSRQRGWKFY